MQRTVCFLVGIPALIVLVLSLADPVPWGLVAAVVLIAVLVIPERAKTLDRKAEGARAG